MRNITKKQVKLQETAVKLKEGEERSYWGAGRWADGSFLSPIIFSGPKKSTCRTQNVKMS